MILSIHDFLRPTAPLLGLALATIWLVGFGVPARGGAIVLPSGLEPGATFQLVFVTSGTIGGASADVATYNQFVTAAAGAAGLGTINGQAVTWSAIVSTPTVDARDNAAQTAPVYNLNEELVVSKAGGLWEARSIFFKAPPNVTETGEALLRGLIWTGSDESGVGRPALTLGSRFITGVGDPSSIFGTWISSAVQTPAASLHVYALSSPIRAEVIAEPASAAGLALGMLCVFAASRSRKLRTRPRPSHGPRPGAPPSPRRPRR